MLTTQPIDYDSRVLNEAYSLSENGYNLTILAKKHQKYSEILTKTPFKLKRTKTGKTKIDLLNIFISFYFLAVAAFRENPDVYHAHDLDGLLCAFLPALFKRKILIYDSHELWSENYHKNQKGVNWIMKPLERFLISRVNYGITVNDSIAAHLKKIYQKDYLSLYNYAADKGKQKSPYDLKKIFPRKKIILHLGAADEDRGLGNIIEAAKLLNNNYRIIFIGSVKLKEKLQKEIEKQSLKQKVVFLTSVKPEEINATAKQADLGLALTQKISLSYFYSTPNKLFQYLEAKTAILGSNFPEFKKVIETEKIGKVVDPTKPKQIALQIIEMCKTKNQQIFRKNLAKIPQNKYSWKTEEKKLLSLYEKI